jgi:hypothetical protein
MGPAKLRKPPRIFKQTHRKRRVEKRRISRLVAYAWAGEKRKRGEHDYLEEKLWIESGGLKKAMEQFRRKKDPEPV